MIVLDASLAIAWILGEDLPPEGATMFLDVNREGALVPPMWWHEVANGLLMALRRGRIDDMRYAEALMDVLRLPVTSDQAPIEEVWRSTSDLAKAYGLTTYDAAYLELALRQGLYVVTLDQKMRDAARRLEISLV